MQQRVGLAIVVQARLHASCVADRVDEASAVMTIFQGTQVAPSNRAGE